MPLPANEQGKLTVFYRLAWICCLREVGWTIASNTSFNDKFGGEGMTVDLLEVQEGWKRKTFSKPSKSSFSGFIVERQRMEFSSVSQDTTRGLSS
jgi:hypothetical protein